MKTKLSIILLALVSGLTLGGCKGKTNSSSSNGTSSSQTSSSSSSSSSEKGKTYTVSDTDYLLIKSSFADPKVLIDGNFTVSNYTNVKVANGKVEINSSFHRIYDIDGTTYDTGTHIAELEQYDYETDHWVQSHHDDIPLENIIAYSELMYFTAMLDSLSSYTYSEETHKYTGRNNLYEIDIELSFEDGKLIRSVFTGEVALTFDISNYGTTTVEIPTV